MNPVIRGISFSLVPAVFLGCILLANPSFGAFLYKKYVVKYDRGRDILCEPYVVQKNDWILKVFKKKGEIAYRDFREFLKIFRRINPHIKNVNRIRPGQYILIPLRKIPLGSWHGQSSGTVTIPFVTLINSPESTGMRATAYVIRKGDCVSMLVSRVFGAYGTASYRHGIQLFRRLNPTIVDLDRVYAGQTVYLPVRGTEMMIREPATAAGSPETPSMSGHRGFSGPALPREEKIKTASGLMQVASVLDARLLDRGVYYFPRHADSDLKLDLSQFPVMVFKDGTRILFRGENGPEAPWSESANFFWKNLNVVDVSSDASMDKILASVMKVLKVEDKSKSLRFSDQGVSVDIRGKWIIQGRSTGEDRNRRICITLINSPEERTPPSIVRYLEQHDIILREVLRGKGEMTVSPRTVRSLDAAWNVLTLESADRKEFVKGFMSAIGYPYAQNVGITFPYAGIQVKAVSNIISTRHGTPVFVDFGDLYGDAVSALQKTGFKVVQIRQKDDLFYVVSSLLDAIGVSHTKNPTLLAAKRPSRYNTALTLPGYMIEHPNKSKILLTRIFLSDELIHFLAEQKIKVVRIGHIPG